MKSPVELNVAQTSTTVHVQTEAPAKFQEALNGRSNETETGDTLCELVRSEGQDLRDSFEVRLKEIDEEMGRFDKVRGEASGDKLERKKAATEDPKLVKKAVEPTHKPAERHDDKPDGHAENIAVANSLPRSRVLEPDTKAPSLPRLHEESLETARANEESYGFTQSQFERCVSRAIKQPIINKNEKDLKNKEPNLIEKRKEQPCLVAQPLILSNGPLPDPKPIRKSEKPLDPTTLKSTWVRRARNINETHSESIMIDSEERRQPIQPEDVRPLKHLAVSNDEVPNLTQTAVAGNQSHRSP